MHRLSGSNRAVLPGMCEKAGWGVLHTQGPNVLEPGKVREMRVESPTQRG